MTPPHLFEGPEKKVAFHLYPGRTNLRSLGADVWRKVVGAAGATILSTLSTPDCDAYLLSESSLFVWPERLLLVTCGRTRLVEAIEVVLEHVPREHVAFVLYERRNEHFPERQPTTFREDAERLRKRLGGLASRFGDEGEHRVLLFATEGAFDPSLRETTLRETTLEILMYEIDERWVHAASPVRASASRTVAEAEGLDRILPGFVLDEHVFDPTGYSLNALRGREYCTVHVTPQHEGSYVSFETNLDPRPHMGDLVERVVNLFGARSFGVLTFLPSADPLDIAVPGYRLRKHVEEQVAGLAVGFRYFEQPPATHEPAHRIALG